MAEKEFTAGDLVKLKSGSPEMTVSSVGNDQFDTLKVYCEWFEGHTRHHGSFEPAVLKRLPPKGEQ